MVQISDPDEDASDHGGEPNAATALLSAASLADVSLNVSGQTARNVQNILSSVRSHLDMDVAFVSEFVGRQRFFRNVDAKGRSPIKQGDSMSMTDGYCQRVVDGILPELIVDAALHPVAAALPDTAAVPIGSHVSVPIRLKGGQVYGTFCCFSFTADHSLNARDLSVMRAFADVAAFQIDHELEAMSARQQMGGRIDAAIAHQQPSMVYQPVVSLADMRVVGIECLARFDINPYRAPAQWFAEATDLGQGQELELQAIRNGLDGLAGLALTDGIRVWLNVSAKTVIAGDLRTQLAGIRLDRVVLDLTEHEHIDDYHALEEALRPLRLDGIRIAIDDAGAGYASMSHILNLEPEYIKLDLSLTRNIDIDRKRCALAAALIQFGRQTGAKIVAEGVESQAEFNELKRLGVHMAQGYFISEPVRGTGLVAALATFAERDFTAL